MSYIELTTTKRGLQRVRDQLAAGLADIDREIAKVDAEIELLETTQQAAPPTKRKHEDVSVSPEPKPSPLRVYTDGSCQENGTSNAVAGYGIFIDEQRKWKGPVGGDQTNNRAEMTAILKTLDLTKDHSNVCIFTDSQYVKRGINEWMKGWKRRGWKKSNGKALLNPDLWKALHAAVSARRNAGDTITVEWVAAHTGVQGNERADQLAAEAVADVLERDAKRRRIK